MTLKRIGRIGIAMLAAIGTLALTIPASAETTYAPASGGTCNFNKYLIMDAGDAVPAASFDFTVAPGTAIAATTATAESWTYGGRSYATEAEARTAADDAGADHSEISHAVAANGTTAVFAGTGTPTIQTVTFSGSEQTSTSTSGSAIDVTRTAAERVTGLTAETGVQLESGEKYATKQATVSFSGITFPEPGIYRYVVTETASSANAAKGIMNDNDVDRVLDAYVSDDGTGTLSVTGYVMHKNADAIPATSGAGSGDVSTTGAPLDDKTDGFTNELNVKDLVIKKEVEGNQASRDKYFALTVTMSDDLPSDVSYAISISNDNDETTTDGNADATSGSNSATIASNSGRTNPTTATGTQLKSGVTFYLQHGQSVAIRGIPTNVTYAVSENAEDYKSHPAEVDGYGDPITGVIGTVAETSTVSSSKAVMTSFKNEKAGIVPTGAAMAMGAGAVVLAFGLLGVLLVFVKSRRREEEEV